MNRYEIISITQLIKDVGESVVQQIIGDYQCPKNPSLEKFLLHSSIEFAKRKISNTFLMLDVDKGDLVGFFSLSHKAIFVPVNALSNTTRKRISRYAHLDDERQGYNVSAFFITQLGKNFQQDSDNIPSGNEILDAALSVLQQAQILIGGEVVYLECENKESLLSFYQNDHNRFSIFQHRASYTSDTIYIQLLRFI